MMCWHHIKQKFTLTTYNYNKLLLQDSGLSMK